MFYNDKVLDLFSKFRPPNTFWSQNLQVLCLKWNSIQKGIQGCWFWIRQLFSYISSLNYLFGANLVPKLQSALFKMKIRRKRYSGVLIPNSTVVFLILPLKYLFWVNLIPKLYTDLFEWNLVQRGIHRCWFQIWQFVNSVTKMLFWGKYRPQNFKVLCFKWNLVQSGVQGCWFPIWQLFLFYIPSLKYLLGQIWPRNFKQLCLKWNVVQVSRGLTSDSTILILNSIPKIIF